jgi:hypothetical protein
LKKRDGAVAEFTPYGVEKVTGDAVSMSMEKSKGIFPAAAGSFESPEGPIHMLIGIDNMKDAPKEQARREGIMLYKSDFGTSYMACGNMSEVGREKKHVETESRVLSCRSTLFHPREFIPAEAMWTELPRRCPACRNAKNASFARTACRSRRILNMR